MEWRVRGVGLRVGEVEGDGVFKVDRVERERGCRGLIRMAFIKKVGHW